MIITIPLLTLIVIVGIALITIVYLCMRKSLATFLFLLLGCALLIAVLAFGNTLTLTTLLHTQSPLAASAHSSVHVAAQAKGKAIPIPSVVPTPSLAVITVSPVQPLWPALFDHAIPLLFVISTLAVVYALVRGRRKFVRSAKVWKNFHSQEGASPSSTTQQPEQPHKCGKCQGDKYVRVYQWNEDGQRYQRLLCRLCAKEIGLA